MKDEAYQARVAALSIAQCRTVVSFLHARRQDEHAENVEAAINAVIAIISADTDFTRRCHRESGMSGARRNWRSATG